MNDDQQWWNELADKEADALGLPDDAFIPTLADVAEACDETWMADARRECITRLHRLNGPAMDQFYRIEGNTSKPGPGFLLGALSFRLADEYQGDEYHVKQLVSIFPQVDSVYRYVKDKNGLLHPLAALIEGWLLKRPVEPDKRATAIMPATLSRVRDVVDAPDALLDLADYEQAPGFAPRPELQGYLPGLTPERSELISPLPLLMWDGSTEGAPRRGKGAPLALRTWIEAVLSLPVDKRFAGRVVGIQWRDFTNWLMPNGEYRRNHYPAIRRALDSVHNLRLPWERNGIGGLWARCS